MTFAELGSVLRAEREKRGLSLDDVAAHLKISARILRALEEGDESSLPHTVYVRGFVRSYGNYLGLDSEELHGAMAFLVDEEQEAPVPNVYAVPEAADSSRSGGRVFLWVFLLLCVGGAAFFWFYRDADLFPELQQARLTTAQPAPSLNARPDTDAKEQDKASAKAADKSSDKSAKASPAQKTPQASQPAAASQAAPVTPEQPAAQSAAQAAAQPRQAQAVPPPTTQAPNAQNAQTAAAQAAQATRESAPIAGHHKVIITALAECWIHSNADSTDTRQFSLRKGDTFALTFANKLVLKLGNAGGVRIRYNGEDLPEPGKEGQVKTLTFPLTQP